MKKITALFLAAAMTFTMLCACGEKETSTISYDELKATDWSKFIELADYSAIELDMYPDVTDAEVESAVNSLITENAEKVEITDRAAKDGDTVNIDFVGKLDGEAFDGGSATGYDLVLGSDSFIDGFEDGIVGKNVGDKFDLNVTFPSEYKNNPDLAGKAVVFEITLNKITETVYPELTDAFIAENTACKTIEEYKSEMRAELEKSAHEERVLYKSTYAAEALLDASKLGDERPDGLYDSYYNDFYGFYADYAEESGVDLETFLAYLGMTEETLKEYSKEYASYNEELSIVLFRIAQLEDLFLKTNEEYQKEAEAYATENNVTVDELKESYTEDMIKMTITLRRALNLITENVVETGSYSDGSVATEEE